jgi:hypothetical protein
MKLISWEWIKVFWIRIHELIIDETLIKFIKQGTQQRERKDKERVPKFDLETQKLIKVTKG